MKTLFAQPKGRTKLHVVLFSGGRGSRVLSKQLINNPKVQLTLAINGYDDGASTGEVRRFLGEALGPSDFRKNASRLARELRSCSGGLIDLLDLRFPDGCSAGEARTSFRIMSGQRATAASEFQIRLSALAAQIDEDRRTLIARKLLRFEDELSRVGRLFPFSDCSLGNLVFAGCFLDAGRDFNTAVSDYCGILKLPDGLIENVTDGTNAYLVAVDRDNQFLASEADIVDAKRRNYIKDIYLIDRPLTQDEQIRLKVATPAEVARFLARRSRVVPPNPRLLKRIGEADLIIYSAGTQHSSLFPSYLTPGLGLAISRNLTAIKLLITNIQEDAEIPDSSAVDIIEKAVRYLKEKDNCRIPTPCLITHYLINDGDAVGHEGPYILPGHLDSLEDPRLARMGNYEEGLSGCHDATRILGPFIESILRNGDHQRVAVMLLDTTSLNKICQTILEMLRGGIQDLPVSVEVLYGSQESFDCSFSDSLPFSIRNVFGPGECHEDSFLRAIDNEEFDYVVLFESSGMYRGEDIVSLVSLLGQGRLDAVWGSRRLSVKDIHESYKLRYRNSIVLGAASYIGSHILSLAYLVLYGRYISDTLSGARAIKAAYLRTGVSDLKQKWLNQQMLSLLLAEKAEVFESPVQFLSISPERVKRTTVVDGLRSLIEIFRLRFKPVRRAAPVPPVAEIIPAHGLGETGKAMPSEVVSSR